MLGYMLNLCGDLLRRKVSSYIQSCMNRKQKVINLVQKITTRVLAYHEVDQIESVIAISYAIHASSLIVEKWYKFKIAENDNKMRQL